MFTIYGKENCQYCSMAKLECDMKGLEYNYLMLNEDFTLEDIRSIAPNHREFPLILKDGQYVGGYKAFKLSVNS